MAQGKLKVKSKLPAAAKGKDKKPKKKAAAQRRSNAPIQPKKKNVQEARKLKQVVTRALNTVMENELREKVLDRKKSLTKRQASTSQKK